MKYVQTLCALCVLHILCGKKNHMKYILLVIAVLSSLLLQAQQADVLIRNGRIIDGTGNNWYYADVAIANGKIIAIGKLSHYTAGKVIDAKGLYVAPGFIDVHTHIEGDEAKAPDAKSFILDGVTSVVAGNCGESADDMAQYFRFIDSLKLSINVAALVGHNTVRQLVMGEANRTPTTEEQQRMEALVAKAMQAGAVGLSTGLIYIPGTYSTTPEVVGLAKVAAQYKGVYATHMRNEADLVHEAIAEAINIGRQANIPVEISHFKLSGQNNWGRSNETLGLVKQARAEGIEVTIDQYPYTASSTSLSTLFPDEMLADGADSVKARINNPVTRAYIKNYMLAKLKKRQQKHFTYCQIASYRANPELEWQNGFAEIIKHAAIKDANMFKELQQHDLRYFKQQKAALKQLVMKNALLKTSVVKKDPFEKGDRKLLNFGHTLGHAIENDQQLSHGYAVAVGMVYAAHLSQQLLQFKQPLDLIQTIEQYGLPTHAAFDMQRALYNMRHDKKRVRDVMHFVLLQKLGKAVVHPIAIKQLEKLLLSH
jgi:N-acyl-D-aspartate/D-glutamate deacylase